MRCDRGVLLIEQCQASGMEQVQISRCKPWELCQGPAAPVADIGFALAVQAACWNARLRLNLSDHLGL